MSRNNKYGKDHREAKKRKFDSMEHVQCEMTGDTKNLNAHHAVPKLFNGPDHESNYQVLSSHFHHQVLHYTCNVSDKELVGERIKLTNTILKHILDGEKVASARQRIEEIDDVLIDEYISNMMNKMQHHYRDKLLYITLINSFKTIRDLNIENRILKAQMGAIDV